MSTSRFFDALRSGRVLLMDGAMGTELQRAGLPSGDNGVLWNLTHPDLVLDIHTAYVAAGAQCLLTNTFMALSDDLVVHQIDRDNAAKLIAEAIFLARSACPADGFVLASVNPLQLEGCPFEKLTGNKSLIEAVRALTQADAILLETCSNPKVQHVIAFMHDVIAGRVEREVPILLSLAYHRDAQGNLRTFSGDPPEAFAWRSIAALGVNCGKEIGMDEIIEIVRRYSQVTDRPLFARPNAGTPRRHSNRWEYPRSPQDLARRLPDLLEAGITMVGGCCGTTPEHIAAFKPIVDKWNAGHSAHRYER